MGLWLSRKFNSHGILVVSGGLPFPKVIKKGGELHAENSQFYSGVRLEIGTEGLIEIGNGTYINHDTLILSEKKVIGEDCKIALDVVIMDSDLHPVNSDHTIREPVVIDDDTWIGCKSIILKGVTVGKGAVIAAGYTVNQRWCPFSLSWVALQQNILKILTNRTAFNMLIILFPVPIMHTMASLAPSRN